MISVAHECVAVIGRYQNVVVPELEARVRDKDQRLSEAEERHNRVIKETAHRARADAEREVMELEKLEANKREQTIKVPNTCFVSITTTLSLICIGRIWSDFFFFPPP